MTYCYQTGKLRTLEHDEHPLGFKWENWEAALSVARFRLIGSLGSQDVGACAQLYRRVGEIQGDPWPYVYLVELTLEGSAYDVIYCSDLADFLEFLSRSVAPIMTAALLTSLHEAGFALLLHHADKLKREEPARTAPTEAPQPELAGLEATRATEIRLAAAYTAHRAAALADRSKRLDRSRK